MWHRFTERSRRVIFFGQEEATKLGEKYVGGEHLLLAMLLEPDNTAARVLARLGSDIGEMRTALEKEAKSGERTEPPTQEMQLTPRCKRVIDLAYEEARQLNDENIGTEHLLLGLIREGEGLAGRFLARSGVNLTLAKQTLLNLRTEVAKYGDDKADAEISQFLVSVVSSALGNAVVVGDLGVLRDGNRAVVEVCADRDALELLRDTFRARDDHGYRELFATGRFFLVTSGTEAKLLDIVPNNNDGPSSRVRILSGEQESEAGWIVYEHWTRTSSDDRAFPPAVDAADFVRVFD